MAQIEMVAVALTAEMKAMLEHAVESGDYASSSEVARDALSDWDYKRRREQTNVQELREAWEKARSQSHLPGLDMDVVMDRLEGKYQALANAGVAAG